MAEVGGNNGEFKGSVKATMADHDRRLGSLEDKIDELNNSINWKLILWFFGYLVGQAGTVWLMLSRLN